MSQEKILVVGGAGFVGSRLVELLTNEGLEVCVFDNFQQFSNPLDVDYSNALTFRKQLLSRVCHFIRGDAKTTTDLISVIKDFKPARVVNFAAVASAPLNNKLISSAIENSTFPVSNILQLVSHYPVERFLHVSSSYVYGDFQYLPCDEKHPCEPKSIYGAVKLASELMVKSIADHYSIPYTIVRLISVYGPGDLNGKLSMQNIQSAIDTGVIPIKGHPDNQSDYTYVDDAAYGLMLALMSSSAIGETVNISRGYGRKLSELLNIFNLLGYQVKLEDQQNFSSESPKRGALSIKKAESLLGFSPQIDLEKGLNYCLDYLRESNR